MLKIKIVCLYTFQTHALIRYFWQKWFINESIWYRNQFYPIRWKQVFFFFTMSREKIKWATLFYHTILKVLKQIKCTAQHKQHTPSSTLIIKRNHRFFFYTNSLVKIFLIENFLFIKKIMHYGSSLSSLKFNKIWGFQLCIRVLIYEFIILHRTKYYTFLQYFSSESMSQEIIMTK